MTRSTAPGHMQKLKLKEIDLRGTIADANDHRVVITLVQQGKVHLEPFITARIALDDVITEWFDVQINHNDTEVKNLVHP